jgi:ribosome assembly protein 1
LGGDAGAELLGKLQALFEVHGKEWTRRLERAISFGPRRSGPSMLSVLLRADDGTPLPEDGKKVSLASLLSGGAEAGAAGAGRVEAGVASLWELARLRPASSEAGAGEEGAAARWWMERLRAALVQGFQLATANGPLCAEPVYGVSVEVVDVVLRSEDVAEGAAGAGVSGGLVMSLCKDAIALALRAGSMRLVEPVYRCQLQCSGGRSGGGEELGSLYAVLQRRRGRVIFEELLEGTQTFLVEARLPVAESFGFANELRDRTSGAATSPQLVFDGWSTLDEDPFFTPTTDEEREEFGDKLYEGQARSRARELVDAVRERKGMDTERKLVAAADKQRTRARKK